VVSGDLVTATVMCRPESIVQALHVPTTPPDSHPITNLSGLQSAAR